jgi:uncharacterized protein (DUF2147 family)
MPSTLLVCLFVSALLCAAQTSSVPNPTGRWKTVDDATGKVTSIVLIWEKNHRLYGRIDTLINQDPRDPDPNCTRCEGAMKNRPLVGLRILWDLQKSGDRWTRGTILDPGNGKIYNCSIFVEDDGKRLKVRGFIGLPVLGRTEFWRRDE